MGLNDEQKIQIVPHHQLDYPALLRYLSFHPGFPCSQHIRNHFLAQYGAYVKHPDLADKQIDDDPWRTYHDYRKGSVIVAIGDVPASVRKGDHLQDDPNEESVWAIVAVFPSYSPGWVTLSDYDKNQCDSLWNAIRTTFWLSTEIPFQQQITPDQVRQASVQERNLLKFIFQQHLPKAFSHIASSLPAHSNVKKYEDDNTLTLSDLHAINHIWMKELQSIQEDIAGDDHSFKMVRCNPCVNFTMPEDIALHLKNDIDASRWKVGLMGDHPGELEMVVKSNNVRYPMFYTKGRRHLSVVLRDQEGFNEHMQMEDQEYPTKVYPGAPAGWAYSHDDFSLGSLHVAEPYRRLKRDGGDKVKKQGVGTVCLALMAGMLVQCQKDALSSAGCLDFEKLPTPIISDAEQHKVVAVAFHRSAGFAPQSITSWGAYAIRATQNV
ncbi:uncharacterized protein FA14DRAFT_161391 [Meira miltonrushii]|uniref:Uncharacterized protein n=1 Tax=Meira miltonrushii TaxID=1280837 RepID=A0A316V7Q3_9BASI|nr:uncharacterized protein FA14DRAFT_161391 [Meira miltonrushii]PWN33637.1 hypothetical protein FA14DRAFT_161391 [Meira miltonrushii]